MAARDIEVLSGDYGVREFRVAGGRPDLLYGEPVKRRITAPIQQPIHLDDGEPQIGTDMFLGIVNRASTQTSSASGFVEIKMVGGGTVLFANATTAGNFDTQAEIDNVLLNFVSFDNISSTYTIDENEADDPNYLGLQIIGGIAQGSRVIAQCHVLATSHAGGRIGDVVD